MHVAEGKFNVATVKAVLDFAGFVKLDVAASAAVVVLNAVVDLGG